MELSEYGSVAGALVIGLLIGFLLGRAVLNSEKKSRLNARRSLYSLGTINSDQKLSYNNIIAKRPGGGISPLYYKKIIGKKLKKKVKDEHKFSWKDFSKN